MITLNDQTVVLDKNSLLTEAEAKARGLDIEAARHATLAYSILSRHNSSESQDELRLRFDALASHDITYVGIIQTARASGLSHFPLPYVLTNCHNSLCAVGGTINEDDHRFGLSAARKYGGIYVPPNLAVIHQYVREALVECGAMILGSDSHTRYGALGVMGFGEGGPELVKQLLQKTYDLTAPKVICVWLSGTPRPGVGPQDVALALIAKVFAQGFVKNKVLEFHGPGIKNLSVEYRSGIDVMTTETTCLSSIWETDEAVRQYYASHGRADKYHELSLQAAAAFDGLVSIELDKIEPMIALPFHPSNAYPIAEVVAHADDYLAAIDEKAVEQFGPVGKNLKMRAKHHDGGIWVEQGVIAGCAGGSFENIALAANLLEAASTGQGDFSLSCYPASQVVSLALVQNGYAAKIMEAGAILKPAFCGPCFGAGDTPANGTLSIRHSTRNFPNREGSKPAAGQLSAVALMDARSIAMTASLGGKLTPATEADPHKLTLKARYEPDIKVYTRRIFAGFGQAKSESELIFGPNITDWPTMSALPEHLVLKLACHILDPVTTTDELIPSGETSSLRSNPLKLSEFTLSRKDPDYVARAKAFQELEKERLGDAQAPKVKAYLADLMCILGEQGKFLAEAMADLSRIGFGTSIFALKPGDGSAREQAASCQKVLGGWANIAVDYATKRYRSNLINWGMLPLHIEQKLGEGLCVGDTLLLPGIRQSIASDAREIKALVIREKSQQVESISLSLQPLTANERQIILAGCLINYYQASLTD
ncbi:MAG: hydratase [Desulfovibrio sp.]|nr:hydratase [Desulfovibrio sp.]